jgi:hypothetical protein
MEFIFFVCTNKHSGMYRTSVHTYEQICRRCGCATQSCDVKTKYMRMSGFYAGQSRTGAGPPRVLMLSPVSIIPTLFQTHIYSAVTDATSWFHSTCSRSNIYTRHRIFYLLIWVRLVCEIFWPKYFIHFLHLWNNLDGTTVSVSTVRHINVGFRRRSICMINSCTVATKPADLSWHIGVRLWVSAPCSREVYWRFRETYCLRIHSDWIIWDGTPTLCYSLTDIYFTQNSHTQHTKQDKTAYMFRLIKPSSSPYYEH